MSVDLSSVPYYAKVFLHHSLAGLRSHHRLVRFRHQKDFRYPVAAAHHRYRAGVLQTIQLLPHPSQLLWRGVGQGGGSTSSPIRRENGISLLRRHCENRRSHAITGLSIYSRIARYSTGTSSTAHLKRPYACQFLDSSVRGRRDQGHHTMGTISIDSRGLASQIYSMLVQNPDLVPYI